MKKIILAVLCINFSLQAMERAPAAKRPVEKIEEPEEQTRLKARTIEPVAAAKVEEVQRPPSSAPQPIQETLERAPAAKRPVEKIEEQEEQTRLKTRPIEPVAATKVEVQTDQATDLTFNLDYGSFTLYDVSPELKVAWQALGLPMSSKQPTNKEELVALVDEPEVGTTEKVYCLLPKSIIEKIPTWNTAILFHSGQKKDVALSIKLNKEEATHLILLPIILSYLQDPSSFSASLRYFTSTYEFDGIILLDLIYFADYLSLPDLVKDGAKLLFLELTTLSPDKLLTLYTLPKDAQKTIVHLFYEHPLVKGLFILNWSLINNTMESIEINKRELKEHIGPVN